MYFHNENTMQQQTLRLAIASFIGCLVKPTNVGEYPSRHDFFGTAADMARAKIMQDVYKNIRRVLSLNCKQLKITREMILTPPKRKLLLLAAPLLLLLLSR